MIQELTNKTKDWFFGKIHNNHLIYNTCWEDPKCDRILLDLDQESDVVMITSAGCNALDYALDKPASIHCIDVNYRQNSLLELKKSFFKNANHEQLFQFFGEGKHRQAGSFYEVNLRPFLPEEAQQYWDRKIKSYFIPTLFRPSFYFHGTAGSFAWLFGCYMRARKSLYEHIQHLLKAPNLEIQRYWYDIIETKIITPFIQWAMKQPMTLTLLGIPASQSKLVEEEYIGGVVRFIQDSLRYIFTELPIGENYFWQLYINGKYSPSCCPNYLKPENFETLQIQEKKIKTHTTTISKFLQENPKSYSHFILLDHQDWLAANNRPALEEEWNLILKNSRPGTKILLRSGAVQVDFFPDFVQDRVCFDNPKVKEQHLQDRVGTYGSVYCGIVQ